MTAFLKMHGLGNDFVVFDGRKSALLLDARLVRAVADRKTGIGCDQLIVIETAATGADAAMKIFNADGGEVESCGNAARCVARLLMEEKDTSSVAIETEGGFLACTEADDHAVTVDMGPPHFDWRDVPLAEAVDTGHVALAAGGQSFDAVALSVGNPHCVLFVGDADAADVARIGPQLERHPLFPARTNIEFVQVLSPTRLRMRVWERGAGITRACGTGACASAVAAARRGLAGRHVGVALDGGVLDILWRQADDHVLMTGPTALSFAGEIDLSQLEKLA